MAQIGITSKETEPDPVLESNSKNEGFGKPEPDPVLESNSKNEGFGKQWPKLELLPRRLNPTLS